MPTLHRVYIAGKITGLEYDDAFAKFAAAEKHLAERGFEPVNPMRKTSEQAGLSWSDYMKEDIPYLLKCDAIYLLPDWKDSRGAQLEYTIARELGLIIMQS